MSDHKDYLSEQFDTQFVRSINKIDHLHALHEINKKIRNHSFKVEFAFGHVESALAAGDYTDFIFAEHTLLIRKPETPNWCQTLINKINSILNVKCVYIMDSEIRFDFSVYQRPVFKTVNEAADQANYKLIPFIANKVQSVGIEKFTVSLVISKTCEEQPME